MSGSELGWRPWFDGVHFVVMGLLRGEFGLEFLLLSDGAVGVEDSLGDVGEYAGAALGDLAGSESEKDEAEDVLDVGGRVEVGGCGESAARASAWG